MRKGGRYKKMPPNADKLRHRAVQRALKMNILFKEGTYEEIMNALNLPANDPNRKNNFENALAKTPLVKAEIDWLWNYLSHCTEKGSGGWGNNKPDGSADLPEAASAGW